MRSLDLKMFHTRSVNFQRFGVLIIFIVSLLLKPAFAISIIRDAEIESSLQRIARPLLLEARLSPAQQKIFVVNDRSANAFVSGDDIFINSGLIQKLKTVEQLQFVIAHEIAHIKAGHIAQRISKISQSKRLAGFGIAVAGVATLSDDPATSAGLAAGVLEASKRSVFAYSRAQESSADQLGMRYMLNAGIDPKAALEVLELFSGQEFLNTAHQDAYVRTHPRSITRLNYLRNIATKYANAKTRENADEIYWYQRMRAKLEGFQQPPRRVLNGIRPSDLSEFDLIRQAMAYYRLPDREKALGAVASLLSSRPDDPFYYALRAQILFKNGDLDGAIKAYKRANELRPDDGGLLASLGRVQLARGDKNGISEALRTLKAAHVISPRHPRLMQDLSHAYAKSGERGMASLLTAQRYAYLGKMEEAATHARRASDLLPEGSPSHRLAEDILNAVKSED